MNTQSSEEQPCIECGEPVPDYEPEICCKNWTIRRDCDCCGLPLNIPICESCRSLKEKEDFKTEILAMAEIMRALDIEYLEWNNGRCKVFVRSLEYIANKTEFEWLMEQEKTIKKAFVAAVAEKSRIHIEKGGVFLEAA